MPLMFIKCDQFPPLKMVEMIVMVLIMFLQVCTH